MPKLLPLIASWRAARPLLLAADGLWDLADGTRHADFASWCAANPRARCTLWLGGAWLIDLVCEAGAPLQSATLRASWARRVLVHFYGDAAAAWALLPWRRQTALGASALRGVQLQALREGWDCPFAYVLCSLQKLSSATAVEQLLGRVLRMPYAKRRGREALNKAYAHVCEAKFSSAAHELADRLINHMGFEALDVASMIVPQASLPFFESNRPLALVFIAQVAIKSI